uniref:Uncharacterized protein MANES_18G067800 n=1 Tax=Rhizophora mucronata TaxID=61149 RepID=A0A2P2QGN8_RHIMU
MVMLKKGNMESKPNSKFSGFDTDPFRNQETASSCKMRWWCPGAVPIFLVLFRIMYM